MPVKDKMTLSERGTKDDWETIKVILDSLPGLRQRALLKLKEVSVGIAKRQNGMGGISISAKDSQSFRLAEKGKDKKEKEKEKK